MSAPETKSARGCTKSMIIYDEMPYIQMLGNPLGTKPKVLSTTGVKKKQ